MTLNTQKLQKRYSKYRYCIVKECKNTSIKTPDKLWIQLPTKQKKREAWLKLAGRDPKSFSYNEKTINYLCEDHFDLENDMENYMEYKIMGSVKQIRMKPNSAPSRFKFQTVKKRKLSPTLDHHHVAKKSISEENKIVENTFCISMSSFHQDSLKTEDTIPSCSCSCSFEKFHNKALQVEHVVQVYHQEVQVKPLQKHILCQANIKKQIRSKQMEFKPFTKQLKDTQFLQRKLMFPYEKLDSDASFSISQDSSSTSTRSKPSSQSTLENCQGMIIKTQKPNLESTLFKIKQKPRLYIGIPEENYFIVELISKTADVCEKHIFLSLMKIRLNRTFSQLGDDFDLSSLQARKIFYTKMPSIVNVLLPLIKPFCSRSIKKNLPIPFRYNYNKVNYIIDCLEIEIQKPKKVLHQTLTWSENKNAYTYKYLISCTPDGFINFVSGRYPGRVSAIHLFEHCRFLDVLEPGSYILADRGFKHIETFLKQRGFTLLWPPSVGVGTKLTKSEVKETKEISSRRIHVERVKRRVREFAILKPHSVVNLNLLHMLDSCVITACGIINLQNTLIK